MNSVYPSLSLEHVAKGMIACRTNARELLSESKALHTGGYSARAYALVYTACEELAKFFVLELGGKRSARGNAPPWKRFWQRFRSHDSKLAQLNVQLLCLLAESEEVPQSDIVRAAETLFGFGLATRNLALYVDTGPDGNFRKPSDVDFAIPLQILSEAAKLALNAANRRGQSIDEIERCLKEPPLELEKRNAMRVLVQRIQRMKEEGIEESEVIKILEKSCSRGESEK